MLTGYNGGGVDRDSTPAAHSNQGHVVVTDNPIHHCFSDVETSGDNVIVAGTFAPPEQIPVPPSNLVANAISTNQINLTWQDNSDNEDGFEIIGRLEPDDDGVWSHIDIVGANTTSYSDSGLLQGAT